MQGGLFWRQVNPGGFPGFRAFPRCLFQGLSPSARRGVRAQGGREHGVSVPGGAGSCAQPPIYLEVQGCPRSLFQGFSALRAGLCVFMADVYMEAPQAGEQAGAPLERPQELHRFLVHGPDGRRLESVAEKKCARCRPPPVPVTPCSRRVRDS